MPSFLRGEEMELVQLIIPKETAYECVGELGRIGVVQFNDVSFCSFCWYWRSLPFPGGCPFFLIAKGAAVSLLTVPGYTFSTTKIVQTFYSSIRRKVSFNGILFETRDDAKKLSGSYVRFRLLY